MFKLIGFKQIKKLSFNEANRKNSGIKLAPWFKDSKLHTPKVTGISAKTGKKIIQSKK